MIESWLWVNQAKPPKVTRMYRKSCFSTIFETSVIRLIGYWNVTACKRDWKESGRIEPSPQWLPQDRNTVPKQDFGGHSGPNRATKWQPWMEYGIILVNWMKEGWENEVRSLGWRWKGSYLMADEVPKDKVRRCRRWFGDGEAGMEKLELVDCWIGDARNR